MPDPNCTLAGCIHAPGFVIACGYDEELALASVGRGWSGLVREGLAVVEGVGYLDQVKEKYGELCLYASTLPNTSDEESDAMWSALNAIEQRSADICEQCGEPGQLVVRGGWYRTACPPHANADGFVLAKTTE